MRIIMFILCIFCMNQLVCAEEVVEEVPEEITAEIESARGLPKVVETVKAIKAIISEEEKDEVVEKIIDSIPKPIKVPQDVINRMMKAHNQIIPLQKDFEIAKLTLQVIQVKLEGLHLARQDELWLYLASIRTEQYPDGVPREELPKWNFDNGIATRGK